MDAIQSIEKLNHFKLSAEKEIVTAAKDTRSGAKQQFEQWHDDFEQALNEIRPFEESMLVKKKLK